LRQAEAHCLEFLLTKAIIAAAGKVPMAKMTNGHGPPGRFTADVFATEELVTAGRFLRHNRASWPTSRFARADSSGYSPRTGNRG
jgi:hypothetical protein